MRLVLKRNWPAIDAEHIGVSTGYNATITAGTHEVERIRCPTGHDCNWLVLKGTLIGASEGSWRQWENGVLADLPGHPNFGKSIDWGAHEVRIVEDEQP